MWLHAEGYVDNPKFPERRTSPCACAICQGGLSLRCSQRIEQRGNERCRAVVDGVRQTAPNRRVRDDVGKACLIAELLADGRQVTGPKGGVQPEEPVGLTTAVVGFHAGQART